MRQRKFRHFDKRYNEMRYSDKHDGEFYLNLKGVMYMYAIPKSESGLETKYYKSYDVEEFTGLQDKNGVDIYEGDILSKLPKWENEVVYDIECVSWICRTYFKGEFHSNNLLKDIYYANYSAIGNIHEK